MSGLPDKKPNGNGLGQKQFAQLIIIMEPDSREVMVKGPINDKGLCYEMLAKAANAIVVFDPSKAEKRLIGHVDPLAIPKMKGN